MVEWFKGTILYDLSWICLWKTWQSTRNNSQSAESWLETQQGQYKCWNCLDAEKEPQALIHVIWYLGSFLSLPPPLPRPFLRILMIKLDNFHLHQTVGGFKTGYPATFPICLCQCMVRLGSSWEFAGLNFFWKLNIQKDLIQMPLFPEPQP